MRAGIAAVGLAAAMAVSAVSCGGGVAGEGEERGGQVDRIIELSMRDQRRLEADVQERTRRCMRDAGFDYVVEDVARSQGDTTDTRSERERHGLGVVESLRNLAGLDTGDRSGGELSDGEIRNAEYVAALSGGDRTAYQHALWGTNDPANWEDPRRAADPLQAGCYNAAWVDLLGFEVVTAHQALLAAKEQVEADLEQAPEVVASRIEWRACLGKRGLRVEPGETDVLPALQRRAADLAPWLDPGLIQGGSAEAVALLREHAEDLDALAEEERELAVAEFDCAGPVRAAQDEVRIERQASWLRGNAAVVETLSGFYGRDVSAAPDDRTSGAGS
ncbi:MAG: hypothetical protein ACOYOQ_10455 [Microthrixaceae bacterium]